MPTQECVWLNNVNCLLPKPGTAGEKNEEETVVIGKLRSPHLTVKDDQLLAEQWIFYNQIDTAAGQV